MEITNQMTELYDELNQAAENMGQIPIEEASEYDRVLQLFFSRARRTFRAVRLLADHGYGEQALILVRTLYEDTVNLLYISTNPDRLAKLFLEYAHFRNFKYLQYLQEHYPESLKLEGSDTLHNLIQEYERVRQNYPRGDSWSGHSISRLARMLYLDGLHETLYKITSDLAHGNVAGVYHFLVTRDNRTIGVQSGTSLDYATQSVILAVECFRLILNEVNRHFKLPFGEALEHTRRGLADLSH
ncbi:DUF5677 domain-containing protein [Candidatus Desulforudis audaxviator]|uniref:Uncharacterized protein n=1 Tax=Desulforudis audaxviator (strain MP104C) TaxID=477974 RepID=B1I2Z6_DESAP|nr:DUF5677 domain-containing protein [Candidatus Desulforudis audaxviator]ACA59365.1 hypothetical protein Daud_0852 [Candidatus Desulforudis audaxviator MP104C]AZK59342.1 hypothetical protein Daudx_0789 [Candidatus Desulforudis audaxviator]